LNENTLKILEKKLMHFRKETSKRLTSFFFINNKNLSQRNITRVPCVKVQTEKSRISEKRDFAAV
jgi:hypothetical protein